MIRAAFRVRGFGRLYAGNAASMLGDSLMLIVMSVWVKTLTGSNGAAGLTFLWLTAPALLAPLFGYVVDRVPRRAFLVVANVLSACAVLPLLLVRTEADVWIIYGVAFLYGISFVVMPAALNGLLKDLLPEDVLVDANASLSVTREAFRLVGPLVGAVMFTLVGGGAVAVVDALTFVVAAVAVSRVPVTETPPEAAQNHWRAEVAAGARHLRGTPVLLHATAALALCLLVVGFAESAGFAVLDGFGLPPEALGPILSVQGAGAVLAGLLSARVIRRVGEPWSMVIGLVLFASAFIAIAAAAEVWQFVASMTLAGAAIPTMIVAYNTLLQKRTPARLMGRVSTTTEVLTTTPQALSIATGAVLVTLLDYRLIFAIMAAGCLVAAAYLPTMLRGRMGEPPGEPVTTDPAPLGISTFDAAPDS